MRWLGLLQGSITVYFLQNLNMRFERGEDVLSCPAPHSKGCLFSCCNFLSGGGVSSEQRMWSQGFLCPGPCCSGPRSPIVTSLPNLRKVPLNLCLLIFGGIESVLRNRGLSSLSVGVLSPYSACQLVFKGPENEPHQVFGA